MPRKKSLIALVMQPPMLVMPQSAWPLPLSPPGVPVPDPLVGGAEVVGCGMQPSPVHAGVVGAGALVPGGVVLVGRLQIGSGEPGVHESTVGNGRGGSGGVGAGCAAVSGVGAAAALTASVPPSRT